MNKNPIYLKIHKKLANHPLDPPIKIENPKILLIQYIIRAVKVKIVLKKLTIATRCLV